MVTISHPVWDDLSSASRSADKFYAFAICSLDGFTKFRREYGFQLGDQVLDHVTSVAADILSLNPVTRTDEDHLFGLAQVASRDDLVQMTERFRHRISGSRLRFTVDGTQISHSLTVSLGIVPAQFPIERDQTVQDLTSAWLKACESQDTVVILDRTEECSQGGHNPLVENLQGILLAPETPLSLLHIDVDQLDEVNDRHGRAAGDQILTEVSDSLEAAFGLDGSAGRLWSDEFLAILPGVRAEDAAFRAEGFRREIAQETADLEPISLSIGVATYPNHASGVLELFRKAREARHQSLEQGGGRVCIAEADQMVTKTSHFSRTQLKRLAEIAKAQGRSEAALLREGLDGVLRVYQDGAPDASVVRHPLK